MLLMPETSFRQMYGLFKKESEGNEQDTMIRLMNYYQVPYMAVLIRCYELNLPESNRISEELLNVDRTFIRNRFVELWLDDTILCASKKDDFPQLKSLVERLGKEYIQDDYLNERTLKKVMQNMQTLYSAIKGD
jgi:Zn-dependent peptidase ImmA (M78 family)